MNTSLNTAFEHLKKLPFPEFAESEELATWQADLAELDGYVVGIITTVLDGGQSNFSISPESIIQMRKRLECISGLTMEDQRLLVDSRNYLNALEEVTQFL